VLLVSGSKATDAKAHGPSAARAAEESWGGHSSVEETNRLDASSSRPRARELRLMAASFILHEEKRLGSERVSKGCETRSARIQKERSAALPAHGSLPHSPRV